MHSLKGFVSTKALLCTLLAVLALTMIGCGRTQAAASPPAPEVGVASVIQQDVPVYSEWVATLDGYVNAQIRPQVSGYISGYIIKQDYKEGSLVRKGQVLFEIDPRPFRAAFDRAKGDLAQAQAQLGKSILDVERDSPSPMPGPSPRVNWTTRSRPNSAPRRRLNRARPPWSRPNSILSLRK